MVVLRSTYHLLLMVLLAMWGRGESENTTCADKGGTCVPEDDNSCSDEIDYPGCNEDEMCCISSASFLSRQSDDGCRIKRQCKNKHGYCIKKGVEKCIGRKKNSWCVGKKCTCCIPRQNENCMDLLNNGETQSGVYTIFPEGLSGGVSVFCDQMTDGGGWTVFLQRTNGTNQVDFARTFEEYAAGFGSPNTEYWIGNRVLHSMTRDGPFILRVKAKSFGGQEKYGVWNSFMVGSAFTWFSLSVRYYSNTSELGDALFKPTLPDDTANNQQFSTYDIDNDSGDIDCSGVYGNGGWWYDQCFGVNPTAPLPDTNAPWQWTKANWLYWTPSGPRAPVGISAIKFMIRPPQK